MPQDPKSPTRQARRRLLAVVALTGLMIASAPALSAQASTVRGESTTITVAASSKKATVPNVVGKTAASAKKTLSAHGFGHKYKAPRGSFVILSSNWTVTKQSPKAKSSAKAGSKVTLTVVKTSSLGKSASASGNYYAKTYGKFATITRSGAGDSVIALPAGVAHGIITATYSGSSNFSISGLDANNQSSGDLPVNTIGAYTGTDVFGLTSLGNPATSLQVSGSGPWTITIAPISSAPVMSKPLTGTGDHVYLYNGAASVWTITNTGESNFVVDQTSAGFPNLAVNEIGNYSGTVPMVAGPSVVEIQSDGAWTVR